jgi:hypothetical protein
MNDSLQWYEMLASTDALTSLYAQVPSLEWIDLNGLYALHNPDRVSLHFNLARFPDHVPEKWQKYSTVYIHVDFSNLVSMHIRGWRVGGPAHIEMKRAETTLISCELVSAYCTADILASYGEITHIGAYLQSPHAEW